jgi:hypothetical protein
VCMAGVVLSVRFCALAARLNFSQIGNQHFSPLSMVTIGSLVQLQALANWTGVAAAVPD